jgi:hypothetical protein
MSALLTTIIFFYRIIRKFGFFRLYLPYLKILRRDFLRTNSSKNRRNCKKKLKGFVRPVYPFNVIEKQNI